MKKIYLKSEDVSRLFNDGEVECKVRYDGSAYRADGCYMAQSMDGVVEGIGKEGVCCIVESAMLDGWDVCLKLRRTVEYRNEPMRGRVLKKIYLKGGRNGGVFLGRASQFVLGEVAVLAESYRDIASALKGEERERFVERVCAFHRVDDASVVTSLSAWDNRKYVAPELMPRRVRIVSVEVVKAREIGDEDFKAMGVDWITNGVPFKKAFVGNENWDLNKNVILYRYEQE